MRGCAKTETSNTTADGDVSHLQVRVIPVLSALRGRKAIFEAAAVRWNVPLCHARHAVLIEGAWLLDPVPVDGGLLGAEVVDRDLRIARSVYDPSKARFVPTHADLLILIRMQRWTGCPTIDQEDGSRYAIRRRNTMSDVERVVVWPCWWSDVVAADRDGGREV